MSPTSSESESSSNGPAVGRIVLGTFGFTGAFSSVTESSVTSIVEQFLGAGGKWIDVAPTYAFGETERLVGRILKHFPRDAFKLASSCGFILRSGSFLVSGRPEHVREDLVGTLERLGLDRVDAYYSHIPDLNTPFDETVSALVDLRQQGLIASIGVSNVSLDQLKAYNHTGAIERVQNRLSFLNRAITPELASYITSNRMQLSVYQAIERGILTDSRGSRASLRSGDLRQTKPEFEGSRLRLMSQLIDRELSPIAAARQMTVAQLAVAWALNEPYVSFVQVGATTPAQIAELVPAAGQKLSEDVAHQLQRAYERVSIAVVAAGFRSVRDAMGLESYSIYSGSASGRPTQ